MTTQFGAFNIKSGQYLGDDPNNYMLRDDDRTLVVWGEMDFATGRFTATRNPVKYVAGEDGTGLRYTADGKIEGAEIDNSIDYKGSHFFDEGFMQRTEDGSIEVTDHVAYAAEMSKRAQEAMFKNGTISPRHNFFKLPE